MRKVLLIGCVLLFVMTGCKTDNNEIEDQLDVANALIEGYKSELVIQENTVSDYMAQIETLQSEKETLTEKVNELEQAITYEDELDAWNYEMVFINGSDERNRLSYVVQKKEVGIQTVNVIGYDIDYNGERPDYNEISVKGYGSGEFVAFNIFGTISKCGLYEVTYENDTFHFELIESYGDLTNTKLTIETLLPEGMPFEAIRWENEQGEVLTQFLSYDGLGVSGELIISR